MIDGKVEITPKDDGRIEPKKLLNATYDSGVSVAELDVTATGKVSKDSAGNLVLQVTPSQSFVLAPNESSRALESLVDSSTLVTVRGQLYKKPAGKQKKGDALAASLKLVILEVQKKE